MFGSHRRQSEYEQKDKQKLGVGASFDWPTTASACKAFSKMLETKATNSRFACLWATGAHSLSRTSKKYMAHGRH